MACAADGLHHTHLDVISLILLLVQLREVDLGFDEHPLVDTSRPPRNKNKTSTTQNSQQLTQQAQTPLESLTQSSLRSIYESVDEIEDVPVPSASPVSPSYCLSSLLSIQRLSVNTDIQSPPISDSMCMVICNTDSTHASADHSTFWVSKNTNNDRTRLRPQSSPMAAVLDSSDFDPCPVNAKSLTNRPIGTKRISKWKESGLNFQSLEGYEEQEDGEQNYNEKEEEALLPPVLNVPATAVQERCLVILTLCIYFFYSEGLITSFQQVFSEALHFK
ncbi:unnamed protein product [Schistocephalus solidus]|uniref:Uncharacterized protein n=1 Tax=Schistocephalus solidus TaxID=70667 RepID=A0A183SQ13_SCHSO|nr:unnamed protein product [Schistocephalus solidus]